MMWCYCHHLRVWEILREFTYEDNINNTSTNITLQFQDYLQSSSEAKAKIVKGDIKTKYIYKNLCLMWFIDVK